MRALIAAHLRRHARPIPRGPPRPAGSQLVLCRV